MKYEISDDAKASILESCKYGCKYKDSPDHVILNFSAIFQLLNSPIEECDCNKNDDKKDK